ncbi:CHAP domain-containing protein [Flavonifractor porci]|uniref:CHAP domain-containing protein n=1 Tax=Flavonifractor porci TaxID=3133422 RepID=UPI0030B74358
MNKEPRLRFTAEERADPALEKPIRKADKAAAKADKAQAKIPKKKVRQKAVDPETGKVTTKLVLEDKKRPPSKLSHAVRDAPANAALGKLHKEIQEAEQDNVGVESAHKSEEAAETGARLVREGYRSHKLKPYRKAAQAEKKLEKANVNALYQKSLQENPQLASNPFSRWQQKRTIKKQYAAAKRAGQSAGSAAKTAEATGKAAKAAKEKAQQAGAFVMRHKRGFILVGVIFLIVCLLLNTMSSCSMMAQSIGSVVSGTTYPSDDPEMVAVEADYAAKEASLQAEIDGIESSHPGYDEYRYDLDMIGHDPHELAAYLSAVLQGYTQASAQAELDRVFDAQYELTLTEEVETRYRTETRTGTTTSTDPETGEVTAEEYEYEVEVPYEYYILNVKLTSKPISSVASELLTPEQLEMYQVYRSTLGNKPLIFGGGSADTSDSESLTGVQFVNGTRPGNQAVVDIAKSQVGNVGGQPYWSWFGFTSRVEWCACFVSWCYGQMGLSEPRFSACQAQGIPWFQSHGQWGGPDYANIAPGDAIFFDWDLDGRADHVGIVVGTDGSRVYTVEGNSGDACKVRSYSLTYECIKGYGLMNW